MGDFVGRKEELKLLGLMVDDRKFRACAVIGRRRIGKTSLVKKFVEDRKSVYVQFVRGTLEENLGNFSSVMTGCLGRERRYRDIFGFFDDLSELAKKERYVFIFDEYPFLCDPDGKFSSVVQSFVDNRIGDSFLIISGSSVSMLENETSSYGRPLYGRVRKLYLGEMPFNESRQFHPEMNDADSLRLYLTVGGVPFYLSDTPAKTYAEYLDRYFIGERTLFHDEGENLFYREFDNPKQLIAVMKAMGSGCNDIRSISDRTGMNRILCSQTMEKLIDMGFVSRIVPMLGTPTKPVRYRIDDRLLSFHYGVMARNVCADTDYESMEGAVRTHLGKMFEMFCEEYIRSFHPIRKIGKWWGPVVERNDKGNVVRNGDGKPSRGILEIDIVAETLIDGNRTFLFTECKFRGEKTDAGTLKEFSDRVEKIKGDANPRLLFFSVSGFTENAKEYAEEKGMELVGPERLFG